MYCRVGWCSAPFVRARSASENPGDQASHLFILKFWYLYIRICYICGFIYFDYFNIFYCNIELRGKPFFFVKPDQISKTGLFWYLIKSDLPSVRYYTSVHFTDHFLQGTIVHYPVCWLCISGIILKSNVFNYSTLKINYSSLKIGWLGLEIHLLKKHVEVFKMICQVCKLDVLGAKEEERMEGTAKGSRKPLLNSFQI